MRAAGALLSARSRLLRNGAEAGVGLPELLVAMTIFSIVVAAVGAVFVGLLDVTRITAAKTSTTLDAKIAMEAMTRSLRVAIVPAGESTAFTVTEVTRVQFYSSLARGSAQTAEMPTRVTYAYDGTTGCVNETQVPATRRSGTGSGARPFEWTAAGTTKCLIRTSAPPAFSYFLVGTILQADGTTAVPSVDPTTDALRAAVVSVEVALDVKDPDRTDVNGVIARDRVTLANVIPSGGTS